MKLKRSLLTLALIAAVSGVAMAHQDHPSTDGVLVVGNEYSFNALQPLPAGWTKLTFSNTGKELHHVQIARLPDGMSAQAFMAELGSKGDAALAVVEFVGGVGAVAPGATATSYVNLDKPGLYVELCLLPDQKGVPHVAHGMVRSFEVTAAAAHAHAAAPKADKLVTLEDYGINLPKDITAGPQVWQLDNKGPEPHEMTVFKLLPGKTVDDLMHSLSDPQAAPAGVPLGGMQALSKGRSGFIELNLERGDYVLLCAIPSPLHQGKPHVALGMIRPFSVK